MEEKKRFDNLDLLKCYAILSVIILHSGLWQYDVVNAHSISSVLQFGLRLLSEGVPIFLIINGFLLLRKKTFDLRKHLKKTAKLFAILIIWAAILGVGGFYIQHPGEHLTVSGLWSMITGVSLGADYNGVLWFLLFLIQVYLIFPIIWNIYHLNFKLYLYFFGIVVFFSVGLNTLVMLRDIVAVWTDVTAFDSLNDFLARFTPFGYVWFIYYFMLGGVLWHYYEWLKKKRKLIGIASCISWPVFVAFCCLMSRHFGYEYSGGGGVHTIFAQVWLIGIFAFSIPYKKRNNPVHNWIASMGKNTMAIYLIHFLIIMLFNRFIPFQGNFLGRLEKYLLVVVCSYLFAVLASKVPGLKKIITT